MKKIFLFSSAIALLIVAGCSGKKEEKTTVPGMVEQDLTKYGLAVTIQIPDSTHGKTEIIQNSGTGTVEIRVGGGFAISLQAADSTELMDLKKQKELITADEPFKLQKFHVDEPDAILYESKIEIAEMEPHYHFLALVKAGNNTYAIKDMIDNDSYYDKSRPGGYKYQEEGRKKMVEEMLKAAKTVKEKHKES